MTGAHSMELQDLLFAKSVHAASRQRLLTELHVG